MAELGALRRLRLVRLGGALILAGVVVALGSASFIRKVDTFQPLGFEGRLSAGSWLVTAVEPGRGLEVGDRILLVNGREFPDGLRLREVLRAAPESALLVQRGDGIVTVAHSRPALDFDVPYLVLALASVVYLVLGLFTLTRDPRRESALFFLWCLASSALGLLSPTLSARADLIGKAIYLVEQAARILLPPLTLHLFLVFPGPATAAAERRSAHSARWRGFIYLPAAVLVALHADLALTSGAWLFGRPTPARLQTLDRLDLYHLVLFALAAVTALLLRRRRQGWEERRQLLWIAVGLAAGYLPFLALYVLPTGLGLPRPEWLAAAAVVPLACVPLTFAYAILRYKLWDIGVIVRDAAAWTITLLLGVLGFSLANLLISRGVPGDFAALRNLMSFLAGIGIAVTLIPTRRTVGASLERLHYRGAFGKRRALSLLGRDLLHERDLDTLCDLLLRRLEDALDVERANLYLAQGESLVPVRPEPGLPAQLAPDALGARSWSDEVVTIPGAALPAGATPPAQRLFAAGYRYAFPLVVRDSRVGLVLVGYRLEAQPLSSEDVDLVRGLLNQAALAIENAQLLDQLHRQLEETLRLRDYNEGVIESSPTGIAVVGGDGRLASANLAFAAIVGVERRELLGRPLAEVLPVEPLPEPGRGFVEISFCDAAGQERHLQVAAARLHTPAESGPAERVLIVQDVGERVAMQNALKESDRLAALGMLAAGVAHEVNTPITGISSYAQMLLAETAASDPRYELLKKVERQTFRASRIVNSLLDFARNRQTESRPVSLVALVEECAELLGERMSDRHVVLNWRRPPVDPRDLCVLGDDGELQQVLTNLMLNAVEALTKGGTMRVAIETDAAAGRVRLVVEDDGPGIPPAVADKLFQPFVSTKLGQGGSGLGLAISYQIVLRHGGDLRAESEPGRGSRFTVELPLLPVERRDDRPAVASGADGA